MRAGVDVVRINLSHGPLEDHLARPGDGPRCVEQRRTPGRRARRPARPEDPLRGVPGRRCRAGVRHVRDPRRRDGPSDADLITVGYEHLATDLDLGDLIVLGDGNISMRVEAVEADRVRAEVERGGRVIGRPGVHLSSERLQIRAPTEHDLELAEAIVTAGVEYVAVSFVRRAADVHEVRDGRRPASRDRRQDRDQRGAGRAAGDHRRPPTPSWWPVATSGSTARSRTSRTCRSGSCATASRSAGR